MAISAEKPPIEQDLTSEPSATHAGAADVPDDFCRHGRCRTCGESFRGDASRQALPIAFEALPVIYPLRPDDRSGGQQAGLDRRSDALATARIGQPRRISHEDHAVIDGLSRAAVAQQLGVAA